MTAKRVPQDAVNTVPAIKRRALLQGMSGVAAAVFGATVARADAMAQPVLTKIAAEPQVDATQQTGYHLTEHIRAYYRTTRL
jgi:hypothetical protein